MTKQKNLPLTVENVEHQIRSFFHPHPRLVYSDDIVNPWTGAITKPERRVKQSFKAECDINNIVKQFQATGQIQHMSANAAKGAYLDLPDGLDFQDSLNTIKAGEAAFATLPAKVRDRFHNDPAEFLGFMADPANQDEAIALGLASKRPIIPLPGGGTGTPPPPSSSTGDLKIPD